MLDLLTHNELTYKMLAWWYGLKNQSVRSYVFVCSTGRCGTNTVSDIFSTSPAIKSLHEPYPVMFSNNSDLPRVQKSRLSLLKRKHLNVLKASQSKLAYVESNHMFIKTFFKIATDYLPSNKIKILHLKRDPLSVARSFYAINSIPGRSPKGNKYLLDPFAEDNLIDLRKEFESDAFQHDFYKCLWYWYEVEQRIHQARNKTDDQFDWLELETKELNSPEQLNKLIAFACVSDVMPDLDSFASLRSNQKKEKKRSTSFDNAEEYEKNFNELLKEKGIAPYQKEENK